MQNIHGQQNGYNLPTPSKQYVNQQYQLSHPIYQYQQSYQPIYQSVYQSERVRSPNAIHIQPIQVQPVVAGLTNYYKELETNNNGIRREYRNMLMGENNMEKINELELLVKEQGKEISQLKIMINDIIEDMRQKETINVQIKEPEQKTVQKKNDGRVGGIRYMSETLSDELIRELSDEQLKVSINRIAVAVTSNKQNAKGLQSKTNLDLLRKEKKRRKEL